MAHTINILEILQKTGLRNTRTRRLTLEFLQHSTAPVAVTDIIDYLHSQEVAVNKTTIYRELEQLLEHHIVQELDFGDRKKRYELAERDHHHHLICLGCGKIEDIHLEKDLEEQEAQIAATHGFTVQRHALEFFGRCATCA